jgi:MFS family permease
VVRVALGAALSLVEAIFSEGAERNRALSVWGAVAGSGAAAGVLLGGVLTSALGWRSVLFVNVPIGIAAILLSGRLIAGTAQLPLAAGVIIAAGMASALVARLGLRRVLIAGLTLFAGGLVWFAQLPVHGSYVPDVRGPSMPIALGLGFAFVPITILAETGVHDREYGLASGLLNTSQQIGGALGLAVLATLATTRTNHLAASHHPIDQALTLGFHTAFLAAAGFVLLAVVAAATIGTRRTRRHGAPQPTAQPGVDPVLQTPSGLRSEPRLRRADPLGFADLRGPALLVRNRGAEI